MELIMETMQLKDSPGVEGGLFMLPIIKHLSYVKLC